MTLALLASLLPGVASGQDQDKIGFYFDAEYSQNSIVVGSLPVQKTGYLVLHEPSAAGGVGGWELCAVMEGSAAFLGWFIMGQAINVLEPPCFAVGLATPLPPATDVLLATTPIYVTGGPEIVISLVPADPASLPDQMSYLDGADYTNIIPMETVTGTDEVAWILAEAPDCVVEPAAYDFDELPVGQTSETTITVTNASTEMLSGDVALEFGCVGFTILAGEGPFELAGGESHEVQILFAPEEDRHYDCLLEFGTDCASVILAGDGIEAILDCQLTPPELDFGLVEVGDLEWESFQLRNDSNVPLVGFAQSSCADFTVVPAGLFVIEPGDSDIFNVGFSPGEPGLQECVIDLGLLTCGPLPCRGTGYAPPTPDQDLVGIFWDTEATQNEIIVADPPETVEGYLVLVNPSQTSVAYWELCASLEGPTTWLDWQLQGDAVNSEEPPCFAVELGTPLPPSPDVLLAVFQVLVTDLQPATVFRLQPTQPPSLPQSMSYAPGEDLDLLLPLDPVTGAPEVAWINLNVPICLVAPTELNFGAAAVGDVLTGEVLITNTGGGVLEGEVSFAEPTEAFAIVAGGGPFALETLEYLTVELAFTPPSAQLHTAELTTGDTCDPVALTGLGLFPEPACLLDPESIDFGDQPLDYEARRDFIVLNAGNTLLDGDLTATGDGFTIAEPGPFTLEPGDSLIATVLFVPPEIGPLTGEVITGLPLCPTLPLAGQGIPAVESCSLMPPTLQFGFVPVGESLVLTSTLTNTGNVPLDFSLQEPCADFSAMPQEPFTLLPGVDRTLEVTFQPTVTGTQNCAVELGGTACGPLNCAGVGLPDIGPDEDLIGIFFDPEYSQNELQVLDVPATVEGYLVLVNPSQTSVGAWELCASIDGDGAWLGWELEGLAVNTFEPPCFAVGLGEPLLPNPEVLLATFQFFVPEVQPQNVLSLGPTDPPSIPGSMAYAPFDDLGLLLPLNPITGTPEVAWINNNLPACELSSADVAFGDIAVGESATRALTITNAGGGVLPGEVVLTDATGAFSLAAGGGVFALGTGDSVVVEIVFAPEAVGPFEALLETGTYCADVPITGSGVEPTPDCALEPPALDFGASPIGETSTQDFTILNPGNVTLNGDLAVTGEAFGLVTPGPFELPPGALLVRTVTFEPTDETSYTGLVTTGLEYCAELSLTGTGLLIFSACEVDPEVLDFGTVVVGNSDNLSFVITNTGTEDLALNIFENCPDFSIPVGGGLTTLTPQETHTVTVSFAPSGAGSYVCEVELGVGECGPVTCAGSAVDLGNPDVLGIYFDEAYQIVVLETGLPGTFPGYLVLKDPQAAGGVAAWECCVRMVGVHAIVEWNLNYEHTNAETPPCFNVDLSTPLPPAPAVVLATFDLAVLMEGGADYYLNPITSPTLPGQFSYRGPNSPQIPLRTITYRPWAAASIYDPDFDGNLGPSPLGTGSGGVVLRWPAPPGDDVVYHLMRRVGEGEAKAINSEPLRATEGVVSYQDALPDKMGGDVYYSYVAEVGGIEVARSDETRWSEPEVPKTAVLRQNYPNPFNPQTTVVFELPATGDVRLGVYDLSGRRVADLASGRLEAGRHERVWTGRDADGRTVPSGAYYARLDAAGSVQMIKMLLLK